MTNKILGLNEKNAAFASIDGYFHESGSNEKLTEYKRVLKKAIRTELTAKQRKCIEEHLLFGRPAKDIADELGIATSTVYKHIRLGLKKLRRIAVIFL